MLWFWFIFSVIFGWFAEAADCGGGGGEDQAQLPPEMFVPNQQRWLELRARNRGALNCMLCACLNASTSG